MSLFKKIGATKNRLADAFNTLKQNSQDIIDRAHKGLQDRAYASEIEFIENWLRDQTDDGAEEWLRDRFGDDSAHLIRSYIYDTTQINPRGIVAFRGKSDVWLYDQLSQFGEEFGLIHSASTWQSDLNFNTSYNIELQPKTFNIFELSLADYLPTQGYKVSSMASADNFLYSFDVGLHSLFDAKQFDISLPVEYSLSTGGISVDYSLADILATWSYMFSPKPGFEVITGFAADRSQDTAEIDVEERVDYLLKAGLQFNWDINALLEVHYKYTGSSGGSIDLIGALGGSQKTGPHSSYSFSDDYYLELFNFSSDKEGADLKLAFFDLLDWAGFKDGTRQVVDGPFKVDIDLNNLKLFGDGFTSSLVDSDTLFLSVQAEHIPSKPAFDFALDIDDLLAKIFKSFTEPTSQAIGEVFANLDNNEKLDVSLGFIGDIEAYIGYSILSVDMKLGLSPATKMTFTPTDLRIELTPSWNENLAQQGSVGDTFFFAEPEVSENDELWLDADYSLQGDLAFHLGVSLDPRLEVTAMMLEGGLDVETIIVDYKRDFKLGPLYENTFLENDSWEFYTDSMSHEVSIDLLLADENGYQFDLGTPSFNWDLMIA